MESLSFYLAPMEGLTTYIFRRTYHKYFGGMDRYFTPFIADRNLGSRDRNEILPEHNSGMNLVPQILTNRADSFLEMARQLADYGYDTVNLNLGCPSGTVTSKGRGAGFLKDPCALEKFLDAVFGHCPSKISVKTRIGTDSPDEWPRLLQLFSRYPMDELIIHPRLLRELYGGRPHTDAFRLAQETLSFPLCYNGDILSESDLTALLQELPGLKTVMIGRGILSRPDLAVRLKGGNRRPKGPDGDSSADILSTLRAFHDELLAGYQEVMPGDQPTLYKMKDFWTFFSNGFESSEKYLKKIRKAARMVDYRAAVNELFRSCNYRE